MGGEVERVRQGRLGHGAERPPPVHPWGSLDAKVQGERRDRPRFLTEGPSCSSVVCGSDAVRLHSLNSQCPLYSGPGPGLVAPFFLWVSFFCEQ